MKRYCLALDLKDDPVLILQYEEYHKKIWPEIEASIRESGIVSMEIYRHSNRLFMIMETTSDFTFDSKAKLDATNPKVQEWEQLMWQYQQAVPKAKLGEKWVLMERIFNLNE